MRKFQIIAKASMAAASQPPLTLPCFIAPPVNTAGGALVVAVSPLTTGGLGAGSPVGETTTVEYEVGISGAGAVSDGGSGADVSGVGSGSGPGSVPYVSEGSAGGSVVSAGGSGAGSVPLEVGG